MDDHRTLSKKGLLAIALGGLALVVVGLGFWARYGGIVFFDMLSRTFSSCF